MSMYVRRIGLTNQAGHASDVRFGSLADITARSSHVRFIPDSGHSSVHLESEKCHKQYGEVNSASGAYGPGPDSALPPLRRRFPAETPAVMAT